MFLDALTAAALAAELGQQLGGARVQGVLQPDRLTAALELYAGDRHYLTLSADPAHEGVGLSDTRARRGEGAPSPLTLALRAHLVGARLRAVVHPPFERMLRLTLESDATWHIVAELTGRLANLVLLDAHETVVAAAHPVTTAMTRVRVVLPGKPYEAPPAPAKRAPDAVADADLVAWRDASPHAPAWRVLVDHVRGVSPLAAREIACRATGMPDARADAADPGALHNALLGLFAPTVSGAWAPCIVTTGEAGVVAYAPYALTHRGRAGDGEEVVPMPSTLAALSAFLDARVGRDPYRAARDAAGARLSVARDRLARRAAALAREVDRTDEIEQLRIFGDLILTWQRHIGRGAAVFTPPPESGTQAPIPLDPALGAVANAQAYYRRYQRKRRAAAETPVRLARVEAALATVDQLATDLALAEDRGGIDAVGEALVAQGLAGDVARGPRRSPPARGLEIVSSDGLTILVGRSSAQNEQVTFHRAARGDVWLHARGVPGGHVIVKSAGRPVPERSLREAAALAAWFSRARGDATVSVDATDVARVRRLPGGGPGMVTYDRETTLTVAPRRPETPAGP
jgi:predicted ribosome quality control (RQC) complex YloA/Tae2 family protein